MAQMAEQVADELPNHRFYSQSLLRSSRFLVELLFFVAVLIGSAVYFAAYWRHLRSALAALLIFLIPFRAVTCLVSAVRKHNRIHEIYPNPSTSPTPALETAVDVVRQSIFEDLFYTFNTLLVFLFILAVLMH